MLTHAKELITQNLEKLRQHWDDAPVGVYSASLRARELHQPITFAAIQSVRNRAHEIGHIDLCIVDECFVAGTKIMTPNGVKDIDLLRCGDTVYNASGVGEVLSVSAKPADETYLLEFSDGTSIECTANHPFFTQQGWQQTRELEVGAHFLASKVCVCCGKTWNPWIKRNSAGKIVSAMPEPIWNSQLCCSRSCVKKLKNPMSNHQSRLKMKAKLREIRHKPIKRGGNGQLLPLPQLALLHALGEGWESEFAIATKIRHLGTGYPTCYKLDLANPSMKIGIELDGRSHGSLERKAQDLKKTDFLISQGWSVYRLSNEKALNLYSTFTSADTLLSSLTGN
jgi:hypothetical protein